MVTIVLIIYISVVRYVSRVNGSRYRPAPMPKVKKEKPAAQAKENPAAASANTDELGLEEGGGGDVVEQE